MKYCPQCRHTYTDETIKFCRDDGTLLQSNPPPPAASSDTLNLPAEHPNDAPPTLLLQSEATRPEEASSPLAAVSDLPPGGASDVHAAPRPEYSVGGTRGRKRGVAVALSALLLAAGGAGLWSLTNDSASTKQIDSIAVLPFVNESGNPDNEYLSDGMTETLINRLSQIPNLNVKARSSIFRYKGKEADAQAVGKELNVQAILNGRVVQRGEQLTLYLELVSASTGNRVWGEQYNRRQTDLVSLQNEIARDVTNKLRVRLSGADEQKLAKTYTANTEAYKLYLQGRFHWNKRTPKDIQKSIDFFNQAVAVDPNFASAYAGLADAYLYLVVFADAPADEWLPKSRGMALKAIALDDNLAEPHSTLGQILYTYDYDFAGWEREARRSIELNPGNADSHRRNGMRLLSLGKSEAARAELKRALEIEPLSIAARQNYAMYLFFEGKLDESEAQTKSIIELYPDVWTLHFLLSSIHRLKGNHASAAEELAKSYELKGNPEAARLIRGTFVEVGWRELLRRTSDDRRRMKLSTYYAATQYAEIGETDKALAALNEAIEERDQFVGFMQIDPFLIPLRGDARFKDVLRRAGFSP